MTTKMQHTWKTKTTSKPGGKGRGRILEGMVRSSFGSSLLRSACRCIGIFRPRAIALAMVLAGSGFAGLAVSSTPAIAQQRAQPRMVEGKVVDKGDTPLKGSVVYLKDDHTLAVKSFIADDKGGYRFGQLSQSTDYELWAELDGKKSKTRTISSFDSKNSFVMDLKIDTGK